MASSNLPVRTGAARPPARTTYLAQSIKLEEGTSPILVQSMVVLIAITLVAAVAWSMMARLIRSPEPMARSFRRVPFGHFSISKAGSSSRSMSKKATS